MSLFVDTQEAPKNLNFEDSSDLDSLDSEARTDPSPPPAPALGFAPGPLARPILSQGTGAFSNYVRARGEPDGRTAPACDQKGRDSDTFTPSPVNPVGTAYGNLVAGVVGGFKSGAAALLHHRSSNGNVVPSAKTIRTTYEDCDTSGKRPDSSSSASSDWDAGQMTVRRQNGNAGRGAVVTTSESDEASKTTRKPGSSREPESQSSDSDRNDFSLDRPRFGAGISRPPPLVTPRTSLGGPKARRPKQPHHTDATGLENGGPELGMGGLLDPSGGNDFAMQRDRCTAMRSNILSHQMHHFARAPPISDVYHDRSVGLGLAPPLSKLLADNGGKLLVERVDDGTVEKAASDCGRQSPPPLVTRRNKPPPPPPKIAAKPHRLLLQKGRMVDALRGGVTTASDNGFALSKCVAEKVMSELDERKLGGSESSDDGSSSQNRDVVSTVRRKPKPVGADDSHQAPISDC